jgi:hypothetical protein
MPDAQNRSTTLAVATAALLTLLGCTADQSKRLPVSGICDPAAAQRLVGKAKPNDAEAMRLTGATIVRQIAPGDPVTQDLRDNRVTIETDVTTSRVVRATCG